MTYEHTPETWEASARQVDDGLELAISYEPLPVGAQLPSSLFGLDDDALRRIVALTLAYVGVLIPVELSILLTNDSGLRALNREYRGKDEATDVLSFPLLDRPLVDAPSDQLWLQPEDSQEASLFPMNASSNDSAPFTTDALNPVVSDAAIEVADDELNEEEDEAIDGEDSFAFLTPEALATHLGDIALSRDAIERQAAQAGHSFTWELAYLLAHGVLHLVGYDDQTDAGYQSMVRSQEAILSQAGVAR